MFAKIIDYMGDALLHPRSALFIMLFFLIAYLIYANYAGAFKGKFLRFGPDTNSPEGQETKFMSIKLTNWKNVISVYFVIFITTVLSSYYNNIIGGHVHSYVYNRAISVVPYSKFWVYLVYLADPFITVILTILNFYAIATFELQYIIPKFLGEYITDTPFVFSRLKGKIFT